jgi:hypothetical protein
MYESEVKSRTTYSSRIDQGVRLGEKDYSKTPLWKKLGIKEASRVVIVGAPAHFRSLIEPLPSDVHVSTKASGPGADVIVAFEKSERGFPKRFAMLAKALDPAGGLWIAYPKKASKIATDLAFENVQAIGLEAGLVDNKSCAIDEDWSALRFVYRLKDRPR